MSKMFSGCSQNVVGLMVDCLSRLDAEIVNRWIPLAGRMTQLMDSLSSSDDWWMPLAGRMLLGSYLVKVKFGPFDLLFDPLWGFPVNILC